MEIKTMTLEEAEKIGYVAELKGYKIEQDKLCPDIIGGTCTYGAQKGCNFIYDNSEQCKECWDYALTQNYMYFTKLQNEYNK